MKAKSVVPITIQANQVTCPSCEYVSLVWKCKRAKAEGWMNCARCRHLLYVPELKEEMGMEGNPSSQDPGQSYSTQPPIPKEV